MEIVPRRWAQTMRGRYSRELKRGEMMWQDCMLEGAELDRAVSRCVCPPDGAMRTLQYSTNWEHGGPLIESDQIYISPPQEIHIHGGVNAGWHRHNFWSATVSARTRTYPNPNDAAYPRCVGRGIGPTPLIAAMRAIVASYGPQS